MKEMQRKVNLSQTEQRRRSKFRPQQGEPYVSVVETDEDPTKVNSWLGPKWPLFTFSTKGSCFLFQRED
jgi:hypothetical protein